VAKRVFVIGPGQHVYDAAAKYGDRILVLDSRVNPFDTDSLRHRVDEELFKKNHMVVDDFVVFGGNAVLNALAVAIIVSKFGKINILVYGAKQQDYTPRTVNLSTAAKLYSEHRESMDKSEE